MNFKYLTNDFTLHLGDGKRNVVSHARYLENWNITFVGTGEDTDTDGCIEKFIILKFDDGKLA